MKTTTEADTVETINTTKNVGNTSVQQEKVVTAHEMDPKELQLAKSNQIIWFFIHLVGAIIALRFIFLILGANLYGFALIIYNLSNPIVQLFQGIFPATRTNGSYFDSAALLALIIWYLFGILLSYIISLFSNRVEEE